MRDEISATIPALRCRSVTGIASRFSTGRKNSTNQLLENARVEGLLLRSALPEVQVVVLKTLPVGPELRETVLVDVGNTIPPQKASLAKIPFATPNISESEHRSVAIVVHTPTRRNG